MVYLIRAVGLGKCKIGKADAPVVRLRSLQTNSPAKLELVATLPGDVAQEIAIHALFRRHRVIGEWFKDEPEIETFFRERAGTLIEVEPEPVDESEGFSDYLHIRVPLGEKARWVKSAARDGRTMSNWVRRQLNVAAEDGDDLAVLMSPPAPVQAPAPTAANTNAEEEAPNVQERAQQELPLP